MPTVVKPVAERFAAEYDPSSAKLFNAESQRIQKINQPGRVRQARLACPG